MSSLADLTKSLESLTHHSLDWDILDRVLHVLLTSPSLPEKTLDICRHTCSQLMSDEAWLTTAVNPRSVHRLFNVLVNIGNLMRRIDNNIPSTTECYIHAIEIIIQNPEAYYPNTTPKLAFRDFIVAAWAVAVTLSFVRESSIPSHLTQALTFGGPVNILTHIGDPNFDVLLAVHDSGDSLIRLLIDPSTGTLPNVVLFPDQLHHLSNLLLSSQRGFMPAIRSANTPANLSDEQYCQESKMATASVLLSLARRFQASLASGLFSIAEKPFCTVDALVLMMHYLAASLYPNASTFNDIGVILCGLGPGEVFRNTHNEQLTAREVARLYYEQGLQLDPSHPHLLSNLGSLLKDAGQMSRAIGVFNHALACHPELDIALVNMANTLRDMGQCAEAVPYYLRAITVNPDFADAYCGLSQSMNAICQWNGRATWMQKALDVCEKQLADAPRQTSGLLSSYPLNDWLALVRKAHYGPLSPAVERDWKLRFGLFIQDHPFHPSRIPDETGFLIRLMEWYQTRVQRLGYIKTYGQVYQSEHQHATQIPEAMTIPNSSLVLAVKGFGLPFILPFHTFTLPLSARTIRLIAHRNALHASFSIFSHFGRNPVVCAAPPPPLHGRINIGYVSGDFSDHPLTHLMKSAFAMHDQKRFNVFLYATGPSDGSTYRAYYEHHTEFRFLDVSSWPIENIVDRITQDQIHVLVNLGGYTKGAKNEIFAARPSPVQISLMGFAGTLAAGWCDYLVCDPVVCPLDLFVQARFTRRRSSNSGLSINGCPDIGVPVNEGCDPSSSDNDWIYTECPIYMPHTYFATDHKQSYSQNGLTSTTVSKRWLDELRRREELRTSIFPDLSKDIIIFANFNQLYKIDPVIFWTWLRILSRVQRSILWLLRFPAAGEPNLLQAAAAWAGPEVASRIRFTEVAPKDTHIARCCVADLVLDTAECSAHTIAADVLWSGTPILACLWPSHRHRMASRVAASLAYATGLGKEMVVHSREEYEERAVALASTFDQPATMPRVQFDQSGTVAGSIPQSRSESSELLDLRRRLFLARETMPLFDTRRWVKNIEKGYVAAWKRWVDGSQFRVGYDDEGPIVIKDDDDAPLMFA